MATMVRVRPARPRAASHASLDAYAFHLGWSTRRTPSLSRARASSSRSRWAASVMSIPSSTRGPRTQSCLRRRAQLNLAHRPTGRTLRRAPALRLQPRPPFPLPSLVHGVVARSSRMSSVSCASLKLVFGPGHARHAPHATHSCQTMRRPLGRRAGWGWASASSAEARPVRCLTKPSCGDQGDTKAGGRPAERGPSIGSAKRNIPLLNTLGSITGPATATLLRSAFAIERASGVPPSSSPSELEPTRDVLDDCVDRAVGTGRVAGRS